MIASPLQDCPWLGQSYQNGLRGQEPNGSSEKHGTEACPRHNPLSCYYYLHFLKFQEVASQIFIPSYFLILCCFEIVTMVTNE